MEPTTIVIILGVLAVFFWYWIQIQVHNASNQVDRAYGSLENHLQKLRRFIPLVNQIAEKADQKQKDFVGNFFDKYLMLVADMRGGGIEFSGPPDGFQERAKELFDGYFPDMPSPPGYDTSAWVELQKAVVLAASDISASADFHTSALVEYNGLITHPLYGSFVNSEKYPSKMLSSDDVIQKMIASEVASFDFSKDPEAMHSGVDLNQSHA